MDIRRLATTVYHLKMRQIVFQVIRRLFSPRISHVVDYRVESGAVTPSAPITYPGTSDDENFCFLNRMKQCTTGGSWYVQSESKLWNYNLHYFDYLMMDSMSTARKIELIESWIRASADHELEGWEPYPLSLRIVNWLKFQSVCDLELSESVVVSLAAQADTLYRNIEYHILANHYFKNGKALLYAGALISCERSHLWFDAGHRIIRDELHEQILPDGGHYEKSPMYHSITLEDLVDIYNVLYAFDRDLYADTLRQIRNKVVSMVDYLQCLTHPDGDIALFNDSATAIAPSPETLIAYAEASIGVDSELDRSPAVFRDLDDSGYFVSERDGHKFIIDYGTVSPEYQPGHTHCDLLSYELSVAGKRLIVDTGVYEYIDTDRRAYCRSTKAHNTLTIDGKEQTDIWGSFRVAGRAHDVEMSCEPVEFSGWNFNASYMPFWSDTIRHTRSVRYLSDRYLIIDNVDGRGVHDLDTYIHLHPDIDIRQTDEGYVLSSDGDELAMFRPDSNVAVNISDSEYYPQFGLCLKNQVIRLSRRCALPTEMSYEIQVIHS